MVKPVFLWHEKALKPIDPRSIVCLSTAGNYTRIFLSNKTFFTVRTSLIATIRKLPADLFIKTERSVFVSIIYVNAIFKDYLVLGDDITVPINKSFYKSVIAKLTIIE